MNFMKVKENHYLLQNPLWWFAI